MGERKCVRSTKKGRSKKEEQGERVDSEEEVYRKKTQEEGREKRTGANWATQTSWPLGGGEFGEGAKFEL